MALAERRKLIVFTDLDGTLLDHETYSFEPALDCLSRLRRHGVPVILTTSKTHAEVQDLQAQMGITDPCIVENGCAVYGLAGAPDSKVFGPDYAAIRSVIEGLSSDMRKHLRGFGDMSPQDVADCTGLALGGATKACQRLASEPFLWSGQQAEFDQLTAIFAQQGLQILQGGRFFHALGHVNKAKAIDWLMAHYAQDDPQAVFHSCALGDGPNDREMILACDTGVVIKNPKGVSLEIAPHTPGVMFSDEPGPVGWANCLNQLMDQMSFER